MAQKKAQKPPLGEKITDQAKVQETGLVPTQIEAEKAEIDEAENIEAEKAKIDEAEKEDTVIAPEIEAIADKIDIEAIDDVLEALKVAAGSAFEVLNILLAGGATDSYADKDPVAHAGYIRSQLEQAKIELIDAAKYNGLTSEEIADKIAKENAKAEEAIMDEIHANLKAIEKAKQEAAAESEKAAAEKKESGLEDIRKK
jgi:hypothetical protein